MGVALSRSLPVRKKEKKVVRVRVPPMNLNNNYSKPVSAENARAIWQAVHNNPRSRRILNGGRASAMKIQGALKQKRT